MVLDGVAAPFEHACQAARLALEVEPQRQFMQMDEDVVSHAPHRMHRNGGEQGIAPLRQQGHDASQDAIAQGQRDRAGQQGRQVVYGGIFASDQGVGRPLERIRDRDRDELRGHHQDERDIDPSAQVGTLAGPDVGPELAEGDEQRRLGLGGEPPGRPAPRLRWCRASWTYSFLGFARWPGSYHNGFASAHRSRRAKTRPRLVSNAGFAEPAHGRARRTWCAARCTA